MLLFLLSLASFLFLFSKSSSETRLASLSSRYLVPVGIVFRMQSIMRAKKVLVKRSEDMKEEEEEEEEEEQMSILDLPELALDCILERLPPTGLCNMSVVCRSLKDRCRSDHLWGRHLREKWGRVIGKAAVREWQSFAASKVETPVDEGRVKGLLGAAVLRVLPLPWLRSILNAGCKPTSSLPSDSALSWYLALESGKFWFPAQVYNRESGHSGFMMSCYDAELCYDWRTDAFRARYPPHGRRALVFEDAIPWERIREPPVESSLHDFLVSDCLNDLHPGDHFEIQWRRNKEFPYGWWYGVVGHLESCDGSNLHCRCHKSDTVVLEFNHYPTGSRWRQATISRKDHREEGNESDGFYGGIRKLHSKEEISEWRRLWPTDNFS